MSGNLKLDPKELVDYRWVTRSELKDYFEPKYYEYVFQILDD